MQQTTDLLCIRHFHRSESLIYTWHELRYIHVHVLYMYVQYKYTSINVRLVKLLYMHSRCVHLVLTHAHSVFFIQLKEIA